MCHSQDYCDHKFAKQELACAHAWLSQCTVCIHSTVYVLLLATLGASNINFGLLFFFVSKLLHVVSTIATMASTAPPQESMESRGRGREREKEGEGEGEGERGRGRGRGRGKGRWCAVETGCTEHHFKLLSFIDEARRKHKALAVCWLDLANAFGSVHHSLNRFSLEHYHAPACMIEAVSNLYEGLVGIVHTKEWSTEPFPIEVGVYQRNPLSVIIFNTVMNTLVDTISQSLDLGYSPSSTTQQCNLLQYTNNTSLLANGPAACQACWIAQKSGWTGRA